MRSLVRVLTENPRWQAALILASLLYVLGAIVYLYPTTLFFVGDDFGYAENLLQSYWAGTYVPSHWLAPVNWTLSMFGAWVLGWTGNFALSSLGVNFAFFLLTLIALERVFRAVGLPPLSRALGIVVLYANPTLFGKTIEYTGVTLSFLFVVLSLLGFLRNAPWVVFLGGLGAAFTRQSGVGVFALLAAPLLFALTRRQKPSARDVGWAALAALGVLIAAFGLSQLPRGWTAQHYANPAVMLKEMNPMTALQQLPVLLITWGNATVLGQLLSGHPLRRAFRRSNLVISVPFVLTLWMLGALHAVELAPTFNMHWPGHFSLLWKLSAVAWVFIDYSALAWTPTLVAGLCASVLILVRGVIWDYYLLDILLLFLIAATQRMVASHSRPGAAAWGLSLVSVVLVSVSIVAGANRLGRSKASTVLFEEAHRSGRVKVLESNMSDALAGWKLFAYYVQEHNAFTERNDLMGMKNYLDGATYYVLQEGQFQAAQGAGQVEEEVASVEVGPVGLRVRYYLARLSVRRQMPAHTTFERGVPEFRRFPTSNLEWNDLVKQGGFFPE